MVNTGADTDTDMGTDTDTDTDTETDIGYGYGYGYGFQFGGLGIEVAKGLELWSGSKLIGHGYGSDTDMQRCTRKLINSFLFIYR